MVPYVGTVDSEKPLMSGRNVETHREEDSQSRVSSYSLACDMLQLEPHVGVMTPEQVRKESYPGVQSTAPKKFSWPLSPITPK